MLLLVSGLYVSMSCYGDDTPASSAGSLVVYRRTTATGFGFSRVNVGYAPSNAIGSSSLMGWATSM